MDHYFGTGGGPLKNLGEGIFRIQGKLIGSMSNASTDERDFRHRGCEKRKVRT